MSSFNKVILMGHLVADPETRTTQTGLTIVRFALAVNRSFTTQTGEAREEVSYIDIDAFGRQAEVIGQYFSKGRPILVEGRLRQDRWESPQGEKRNRLVVALERFSFVGRKDDPPLSDMPPPPTQNKDNPTTSSAQDSSTTSSATWKEEASKELGSGDIPF